MFVDSAPVVMIGVGESMKKLGDIYIGYGFLVGGALFLLLLVGTQAAHSTSEAVLALVLGLITPIPMLVLGVALRRGWKAAPLLCIAAPLVLSSLVAHVWARPQPPWSAGALTSFIFNAEYGQLYFLPCAIVLGVIVAARTMSAMYRRSHSSG